MRISGVTYVHRKTHRTKNIVLLLLIFALLVSNAVMFLSAYTAWKFIHPAKEAIPAFSSNIVPEYQNISFTGKDKSIQLKGWYFRSKDSEKTVVIAHGQGQNRLPYKEQTLDIIKGLINKGYNVLTFDFRNSGESGGKLSTLGMYEKEDLQAAVKFAKAQGGKKIALLGFSTGASVSLLAASENPDILAVIADSPYSDLKQFLTESPSRWSPLPAFPFNSTIPFCIKLYIRINYEQASPVKAAEKIAPRPVLLIHSSKDPYISSNSSRSIYNALASTSAASCELWETGIPGHATFFPSNPSQYMDRITAFLDKATANKDKK